MKVTDLPFFIKLSPVKESASNFATGTKTITEARGEQTDKDPSSMDMVQMNVATKTVTLTRGEGTDKDPYNYLDIDRN